ncbi:type II toxin-antitoxin system Phd/YefM family antitoxin [Edaphobacter modestus]|uniref:Antitoxin n=1 Tax=Edaphobacter modestus TaxID=388466 RepID=A0A4Q7YY92_9BACT|nr:type II toxin-antitoxin system Phd/YefM family antitoxin [Edaphobacter modestus]RZU42847.1 hypothetical protein BDD14_4445 [Edaphobacter modestus]
MSLSHWYKASRALHKLIASVESGEEVIITRTGKAAVKLVMATRPARKSHKDMFGSGIGKLWIAEDAFSPKTDTHLQQLFEGEDPLEISVSRAAQIKKSFFPAGNH